MSDTILPFSLAKSNEKLTDRGALALVDEYAEAIGLPQAAQAALPAPGSNRGIDPADYVRTLVAHFADGGRFLEDVRRLRRDAGFRELIEMDHMPGPDAVGDWLRRMGETGQHVALRRCNDRLVRRYLRESSEDEKATSVPSEGLTLDIDATIIESDKGDGQVAYDGTVGYHPMLGFLSDGRRRPCCSYVQFRPGNASAQVGIDEAIRHTVDLAEQEGRSVQYVRSDSAGYQSDVVNLLEKKSIRYAITAAFDAAVKKAFRSIPKAGWQPLRDRDGFTTGREVSETVHTMNESSHAFRLILWRERPKEPTVLTLFGEEDPEATDRQYGAVITNIPRPEKSAEEVLHAHQGRGNVERFIGEAKCGIGLRHVPCEAEEANRIWFAVGMLTYNILKLMQREVLPTGWRHRTIRTLRRLALRLVGKVTKTARQVTLQVRASACRVRQLRKIRHQIGALASP
jgi:hypothetical protein